MDLKVRFQMSRADPLGGSVCSESGINEEQLLNGSRRKAATEARSRIIRELVAKSGFALTKVARLVGISPSGVANVLKKTEKDTGK